MDAVKCVLKMSWNIGLGTYTDEGIQTYIPYTTLHTNTYDAHMFLSCYAYSTRGLYYKKENGLKFFAMMFSPGWREKTRTVCIVICT